MCKLLVSHDKARKIQTPLISHARLFLFQAKPLDDDTIASIKDDNADNDDDDGVDYEGDDDDDEGDDDGLNRIYY